MGSIYDFFMRPLEARGLASMRQKLAQEATGHVLEIGAGTGANMPFFVCDEIENLTVSDQKKSKHIEQKKTCEAQFIEADVTTLPFADNAFDTVIHTLVFCSVGDVNKGLQEIKRVLKPDGTLLFIEHVLPQKKGLRRLFQLINPVWRLFSHGCSLTKDFHQSLTDEGFRVVEDGRFMNTVFYYGKAYINKEKSAI